ncbi:MAG TPA: RcnB family protein [Allosphingosinicella sp.]|nr:RcnB family protein [Allosphingosinicella sp.]
MRMLSLTLLAASIAVLPAAASAQPGPRGGPRAGATWRGGGMTGPAVRGPNIQMRGPGMQGRTVRMHGGQMHGGQMHGGQMHGGQMHGGQMHGGQMHGRGNFSFHRWGPHPGRNFRHSRLRRGFVINPFWFAPQFYIGNWQTYGFAAPGEDQRWVRYYDDAYLIDGGGRVLDERYGVDWDNYGEEWGDQDGIPAYRGEWREGGEDGDYAEEEYREEHHGRGGHGGPGYGPPPPGYGGPGYGHGATYGGYYGYGAYAYPIVIETVTTTGGGYSEEITEEYVEVRQRHRARRPRPRCQCAPPPRPAPRRPAPRRPRPPAGERG